MVLDSRRRSHVPSGLLTACGAFLRPRRCQRRLKPSTRRCLCRPRKGSARRADGCTCGPGGCGGDHSAGGDRPTRADQEHGADPTPATRGPSPSSLYLSRRAGPSEWFSWGRVSLPKTPASRLGARLTDLGAPLVGLNRHMQAAAWSDTVTAKFGQRLLVVLGNGESHCSAVLVIHKRTGRNSPPPQPHSVQPTPLAPDRLPIRGSPAYPVGSARLRLGLSGPQLRRSPLHSWTSGIHGLRDSRTPAASGCLTRRTRSPAESTG